MRIIIVGIGDIGLELAKNLAHRENNELVLIDADQKRCDEIAEELDALVLHGDGNDPEVLNKAGLPKADALIAATGSDAINTIVAVLGRRAEVGKIIVKLNEAGLRSACHEIGVTEVITPKISAVVQIVSTLYGFHRINFSLIASGGLELDVATVGKNFSKPLSAVEIPAGAHIVAVMRQEKQMLIPRPDLKLAEGDNLLLLTEKKELLDKVDRQLKNES